VQTSAQTSSQHPIANVSQTTATQGVQSTGGFVLEAAQASKVHDAEVVLVVLLVVVVPVVAPVTRSPSRLSRRPTPSWATERGS
jgi:hypothetical protein